MTRRTFIIGVALFALSVLMSDEDDDGNCTKSQ